jgi:hypothetical protein
MKPSELERKLSPNNDNPNSHSRLPFAVGHDPWMGMKESPTFSSVFFTLDWDLIGMMRETCLDEFLFA